MTAKSVAHVNCGCKHEFQDAEYGKGIRVANIVNKSAKKDSVRVNVRCTVCAREHDVTVASLH
jgi:hypothetical protein